MPYTLNLSYFDLASVFSAGLPSVTGSIFAPPPPSGTAATPLATTTSAAATPATLSFTSAAVPPAGSSSVLVTDPSVGGDILRSGIAAALPVPGTGTVITVPTISLTAAFVAGRVAAAVPVGVTAIPTWVSILSGVLSLGTLIPTAIVVLPPIVTLGAGSITATVTGTVVARTFFFTTTMTFGLTVTFTPLPSGDPTAREHVIRVVPGAATITGVGPIGAAISPLVASVAAKMVEDAINSLIATMAASTVSTMGFGLTPTAAVCARRIVITPAGIALSAILSDLLGPAVLPLAGNLSISISPTPVVNALTSYTITVTNSATGAPVPMANVTLHNFTAAGVAQTTTVTTNAAGQATFNVALRTKKTTIVVINQGEGGPVREREVIESPPTLAVTASGFNSVTMPLL